MRRRLWLLLAAVVLLLGASGAAGYFLLAGPRAEAGGRAEAGVPVRVGELTTNLADPGGRRLIQVEVELQVADRKAARRLEEQMTRVRDAVLQVLRARTFEQVTAPDAMETLRRDIRAGVSRFVGVEVRDVVFGRFIVQ